jgi:hypothetical protein
MRVLVILLIVILLASCVSKIDSVNHFSWKASLEEASPAWLEGIWRFEVFQDLNSASYKFDGVFTQRTFNDWVCDYTIDYGAWKELEVTFEVVSEGQEDNRLTTYRSAVAAYSLDGASLEIYMPSSFCAHEFKILKTKLSQDSIYGFQTIDARFWGSNDVTGKLEAFKVNLPASKETKNGSDSHKITNTTR